VVKALLLALLAIDAAWFAWSGAMSKALDAAAWLTLLALFDIETRLRSRPRRPAIDLTFGSLRLAAAAGVIVATLRYVFEDNVLDTINSALWIGVVVLLETEFRFPVLAASARTIFASTAALLYCGLAVLVGAWAWRGEWFDAWDALLWLIAFALLELQVPRAAGAGLTATAGYTPLAKP
jgi:hypothetical protein